MVVVIKTFVAPGDFSKHPRRADTVTGLGHDRRDREQWCAAHFSKAGEDVLYPW